MHASTRPRVSPQARPPSKREELEALSGKLRAHRIPFYLTAPVERRDRGAPDLLILGSPTLALWLRRSVLSADLSKNQHAQIVNARQAGLDVIVAFGVLDALRDLVLKGVLKEAIS